MKVQTSINIDEQLLEQVRESGVRNISRYVTRLIQQDLKLLISTGTRRANVMEGLHDKLERWRVKWDAYELEVAEDGDD